MKSVLVIDSNNLTREALVNVVSSTFPEATVIAAPDGSKGLHMAYNKQPDVIILEGELTGLDSFRTAKVLRHLPETRQIPLIALTCDDVSDDDDNTSLKATCHASMTKPVSPDKLIQTINSLQGEGGHSQFVNTDFWRHG
ncbi:MAG: response regulator [Ardenticatenaceae bacterium]|nr:response regulator [Ardenticatenaceae bacterium]MCB9446047.1 response regulator [Ardenticatenaceae bacterium]